MELKSFPTVADEGFRDTIKQDKLSKSRIIKKSKASKCSLKRKPIIPWSSKRTSKIMNTSKYALKV